MFPWKKFIINYRGGGGVSYPPLPPVLVREPTLLIIAHSTCAQHVHFVELLHDCLLENEFEIQLLDQISQRSWCN